MWVNQSLHNNIERATINHVKRNALFPRLHMTSYDRSRINRLVRDADASHAVGNINLVGAVREEALGIVIRKCVTTKSPVRLSRTPGVRSSGTAIEIDVIYSLFRYPSSNSYDSGVTGTRNRSDSHDCMPLRIYLGASKSVNQLASSSIDQSSDSFALA